MDLVQTKVTKRLKDNKDVEVTPKINPYMTMRELRHM
jgi:hypothetical protein